MSDPEQRGQDATTEAIYEIVHTFGAKEGGGAQARGIASGGPADSPDGPISSQPSDGQNIHLENWLIRRGALNRRSVAQRQIIGCLSCKLACAPARSGIVTSPQIAACTGMENVAVRRVLAQIKEGGYIDSRILAQPAPGTRYVYRPPEQFSLTRVGTMHFREKLETPPICGLEQNSGPRRLNHEGERKLIEAGVFENRLAVPRVILGCLACRQQSGEGVYISGLEKCQRISHGNALTTIRRMVETGVLRGAAEKHTGQGRPRIFYTLADTDLAQSVAEVLEAPSQCRLERGMP